MNAKRKLTSLKNYLIGTKYFVAYKNGYGAVVHFQMWGKIKASEDVPLKQIQDVINLTSGTSIIEVYPFGLLGFYFLTRSLKQGLYTVKSFDSIMDLEKFCIQLAMEDGGSNV